MACPGSEPDGGGATPARRVAYEVLRRTFEHDAWTDRAFRSAADRHRLEARERAFAQRLTFGAVKRRGTSDHIAEELTGRPLKRLDPPILAALRLGLYELLFEDAAAHAAVAQAVELAKGPESGRRRRAAAGLVNAVLRRAARESGDVLAGLDEMGDAESAAIALSYPAWMVSRLDEELGIEDARSLLRAQNEPGEGELRVNTLRIGREALLERLRAAGEDVARPMDSLAPAPASSLIATGPWGPALREAVAAGELVPQSRGSQLVAELLDVHPGQRILDLCAGPGIKSTQVAALGSNDVDLRSIELDEGRASQISELAARLGARVVTPEVADATVADLGEGYDRVLVDPPCTDLGAMASRPDVRWRKRPGQADELAGIQARILGRAARAVRPGGALVYSTCTISRAENEAVVIGTLARDPELKADDLGAELPALASPHDRRFVQTRPDRDGTDGFFLARLRRHA